ncbi:MAG: pyridoxamine 5'-phosphate oxidase family protein [Chloroflexota bacterium]|nr:pyridoxamine 5'-phosphate oxidase family protein [Chloroflexota bacterium]
MATAYSLITDEQAAMIRSAPVFFVGSADFDGGKDGDIDAVNVSPKGGVPLHIISPNRVAYLDYVGSGNETARHSDAGSPVTVMVCSFEEDNAGIIRLYGRARTMPIEDSPLADLLLEYAADDIALPMRQVIDIQVEKTSTSCGYGVPVMSFERERTVGDRGRMYKGAPVPQRA